MKANIFAGVALSTLVSHTAAKELRPSTNEVVRAKYDSGSVHHEIMGLKHVGSREPRLLSELSNAPQAGWDRQKESGQMDSSQYKSRAPDEGVVECVDGVAEVGADSFKCSNVNYVVLRAVFSNSSFPDRLL